MVFGEVSYNWRGAASQRQSRLWRVRAPQNAIGRLWRDLGRDPLGEFFEQAPPQAPLMCPPVNAGGPMYQAVHKNVALLFTATSISFRQPCFDHLCFDDKDRLVHPASQRARDCRAD